MKLLKSLRPVCAAAAAVCAGLTFTPAPLRAADHGDSPIPSNNQEVDIADVFLFMDPNTGSTDNVILIVTIRGFIAAGENSNFGIFDPNVRYHFELETSGPPDTKADKSIDITFSPRVGAPPSPGPAILEVPVTQAATITFGNFKDGEGKKIKSVKDVPTTPSSTGAVAPAQIITDIGNGMKFCAGMVDDPFFFDIPATGAFIQSVRNGAPDGTVFQRGRDSFAGYNVMGIALSIPKSLLVSGENTIVGAAFYAQKQIVQNISKKDGALKGKGTYKTLDRMGNPAVNVVLIPFSRKNEYNQGTPKDDANLRFGVDILATLDALGTDGADVFPPTGNALALAGVAVLNGDYLRLNTATANDGMIGTGFPNGRRLADDTVDILLTLIANGNPFDGTFELGDNVNGSDPAPQTVFPFLALPNQPLPRGGMFPLPDTNVDDKTRN